MPRHSLPPDETGPAETSPLKRRAVNVGAVVGRRLADLWLWFGRALITTVVVVIVLCRLTGVTSDDLPTGNDNGPFLPQFAMFVVLVFGVLSPFILLPCSLVALARREGSLLRAQTVLGPRSIDVTRARPFLWQLPSRGGLIAFIALVGGPSGLVVLKANGSTRQGDSLDTLLAGMLLPVTRTAPGRGRVRRVLVTIVAPTVGFFAFIAIFFALPATAAMPG